MMSIAALSGSQIKAPGSAGGYLPVGSPLNTYGLSPHRRARLRRAYQVRTLPAVTNDGSAALGFKSGISRDRSAAVI